MNIVTRVQILDEAICIPHRINNLEKGMIPTILLQLRVNSRKDWTVRANVLGEGNFWTQSSQTLLKSDLVLNPAWAEGLVNVYW